MNTDNIVAILITVAGLAGAWAMLFAPMLVPKGTAEGSFYIGTAIAFAVLGAATFIATGGSNPIPGIGMIASGCLLLGFVAWYFLSSPQLVHPDLRANTSIQSGGNGGQGPAGADGGNGGDGPVAGGGGAGGIAIPLLGGGHIITGGAGGGGAGPPGGTGGDGGSVRLGTVEVKGGEGAKGTSVTVPNISFQKIAFFWVEAQPNVYEIGIVVKLFNLDERPYLINGIAFDWVAQPEITGRGVAHVRTYDQFMDHDEIVEDNFIKAGNDGYYKRLLPIRVGMTISGGPPPEFFLAASWSFLFEKQRIKMHPEFRATHDSVLSRAEWEGLLKPKSMIKIDDLQFARVSK